MCYQYIYKGEWSIYKSHNLHRRHLHCLEDLTIEIAIYTLIT